MRSAIFSVFVYFRNHSKIIVSRMTAGAGRLVDFNLYCTAFVILDRGEGKPNGSCFPADGVEKFAIANMNRFVDVFDSQGKQLAQLDGDGITAVPAVAEFHPTHNWVAGGTGSGKLCLWM